MNISKDILVSLLQEYQKMPLLQNIINTLYSISEATIKLLSSDRATIYLYDNQKNELYSYVASKLEINEIRLKVGEGIAGKVAATKKSLIINNVNECADFDQSYDLKTNYKTEKILTTPLLNRESDLIGVVQVLNKTTGGFVESDLEMLNIIASVSAVALEQARLANENLILKEYNRQLIQNINMGVIVMDSDWVIHDFNDRFLEIFGLSESIKSGTFASILPDIYNQIKDIRKDNIEIRIKNKYYNLILSGLKEIQGMEVGKLILIKDITEEMAERTAREIEDKMAILGKMSSQIIHDIKNPLFVMKGFLKLIGDSEKKEDKVRYTSIIESEISKILNITQEILEFTKGDIEITLSKLSPVAINHLLLDLMDKTKEGFSVDIQCVMDNNQENKILKIDKIKLERAVRNLVLNAIEAIGDEEKEKIALETKSDDTSFFIQIKDNGIGIPEENRENIFKPFMSHKRKGTGLGLSIARAIVEKHGGSLNLKEEKGWKTVFEIQIPFCL